MLGGQVHQALGQGAVSQRVETLSAAGVSFEPMQLFTPAAGGPAVDTLGQRAVSKRTLLQLDREVARDIANGQRNYISLVLPTLEGPMVLDLERVDITAEGFRLVSRSRGALPEQPLGAHYQGVVRGQAGSFAAISVVDREVMGLIATVDGDHVLALPDQGPEGVHLLYRAQDLLGEPPQGCGTTTDAPREHEAEPFQERSGGGADKCVRYYWEINYNVFESRGGMANTVAYALGIFNQTAILFANDELHLRLQELLIWDVPSPYVSSDIYTLLDQFSNNTPGFNGDLGHLIGTAGNGGLAGLNVLCAPNPRNRLCYSGIHTSFANLPTYSWTVKVVAHEQGHLMGSEHTHDCAWNGNNTAIDACASSNCWAPLPNPAVGGTIMSYCAFTPVGVNFINGFGPQPAARMADRVEQAACLSSCTVSCGTPTALQADAVNSNSALLTWTAVPEATGYALRWKAVDEAPWNLAYSSTTELALSGLSASTSYTFKVMTLCSGAGGLDFSAYSVEQQFTTPGAGDCATAQVLSASPSGAYAVALTWAPVPAAMSYTVQHRSLGAMLWSTAATATEASVVVTPLTPDSTYEFRIVTTCSGGASPGGSPYLYTVPPFTSCSDPWEPNNLPWSGPFRTLPGTFHGTIGDNLEADYFRFAISEPRAIHARLTELPANYDLYLVLPSYQILTFSGNGGTADEEFIYSNLPAGEYAIRVSAWPGEFVDPTQCYTLFIETLPVGTCLPPNSSATTALPMPACVSADIPLAVTVAGSGPYCIPQQSPGTCATGPHIARVQLNTLDNTTACGSTSGYSDHTDLSTELAVGGTYSGSVTVGQHLESVALRVWIDWNQDGEFTDVYDVITYLWSSPVFNFNLTVPGHAVTGATRMRVRLITGYDPQPCASYAQGETEDYTIIVTGGLPAPTYAWSPTTFLNDPTSRTPTALGVTSNITYTVTVTSSGGCSGTATVPVAVVEAPQNLSIAPENVRICPGEAVPLGITLPPAPTYCIPSQQLGELEEDEYIALVTFAGINNASGSSLPVGYQDFTSITGTVTAGATALEGTVIVGQHYPGDVVRIWFDWDQDGHFDDATELVTSTGEEEVFTFLVDVPAEAWDGPTTMRVRLVHAQAVGACGPSTYGESEDYSVVVSGGVSRYTYQWGPSQFMDEPTSATPVASGIQEATVLQATITSHAGCVVQAYLSVAVDHAPEFLAPIDPGSLCPGDTVQLFADFASAMLHLSITSPGFLDETSWTILDAFGSPLASGGFYPGIGHTIEEPITLSPEGPFTFQMNTVGAFGDNMAEVTLRCGGTILFVMEINGNETFEHSAFPCSDEQQVSWSPAGSLNDASIPWPLASPTTTTTYLITASNGICGSSAELTLLVDDVDTDGDGLVDCLDACPLVVGTIGDPCNDNDTGTENDVLQPDCSCAGAPLPTLHLDLRMALEGPYDPATGLMNDALRLQPDFPLAHPYTDEPYLHNGTEDVALFLLYQDGPQAVVDWVLVELRHALDPLHVVAARAGLLLRDGSVVDVDGVSPLLFHLEAADYRVAVWHRNHLAMITAAPYALNSEVTTLDLRLASVPAHGTEARKAIGGNHPALALWAGDVVDDDMISYTGANNDRDPILLLVGGTLPTNVITGYYNADVNMDGHVKYTGTDNDRDPILFNIGGVVPTNTRSAQMP